MSIKKYAIPDDYNSLFIWIDQNKEFIYQNTEIINEILKMLNFMLDSTNNSSGFRNDIKVLLKTIKTEHEAFIKETSGLITLDIAVQKINEGFFQDFFKMSKNQDLSMCFADILNIEYESSQRRILPRKNHTVENICELQQPIKNDNTNLNDKSAIEIEKIVKTIRMHGNIIDFYKLIIDKNSFASTIFNIYNLSLAISNNIVEFCEMDNTVFLITNDEICKSQSKKNSCYSHGKFVLTLSEYNNIVKKYQ